MFRKGVAVIPTGAVIVASIRGGAPDNLRAQTMHKRIRLVQALLTFLPLEQWCPAVAQLKANPGSYFAGFSLIYSIYVLRYCRSRTGDATGALQ